MGTEKRKLQLKCQRKVGEKKRSTDPTWNEHSPLQQAGLVSPAKSDLLRFGCVSVMQILEGIFMGSGPGIERIK